MRKSVIYVLVHPLTKEIRYCGGTVQKITQRLYNHVYDSKNLTYYHHCSNWIRSLLNKGLKPEIIVIQELDFKNYFEIEKQWIAWLRLIGTRLTNSTDGGEGTLGYVFSEESKQKMSLAAKDKPKTKDHRENISLGKLGKSNGNEGNKHSLKTIEKLRQSGLARTHSKETKDRMSESQKGKHSSPKSEEHKARLSLAGKEFWARQRESKNV